MNLHESCHQVENPLQSIVDHLTAKNQELEAQIEDLRAKAAI
jgi:cell division protein FtsB